MQKSSSTPLLHSDERGSRHSTHSLSSRHQTRTHTNNIAPTVSGFWHWIVYDIPASTTSLPTGAGNPDKSGLPAGAKMLRNDAGFAGYVGCAPPPGHGPHRYQFAVTALGVESLPIDENTSPAICQFQIFGAGALARGFLTGHFGR